MDQTLHFIQTFVSRLFGTFIFMLGLTCALPAQNLVPNPSFETFTICPTWFSSNGGPLVCTPWVAISSADFFNVCAPFPVNVPFNFQGEQFAHTGVAYTGMYYRTSQNSHEYIQAPLLQTLEAGVCYKVGYWMNLGEMCCGTNRACALLTPNQNFNPIGMNPQVDWGGEFFSDTINWIFIWDYVQAVGNEAFITIGNFHDDSETAFDPNCPNDPPFAYYYVDDVIVEEVPTITFELFLDATAEACDSFLIEPTIFPNLTDVAFEWNTGSHDPYITVYASGEYTLTATYGCFETEATIEVTLTNPPPPDLGPDITLCAGDNYTISLDPSEGTYEWNDGSNDADYTISGGGIYSVTLDDGCDLLSDTMVVAPLEPPDPFSLGADTFLCPGDEIVYVFDPSLGDFHWQNNSDENEYDIHSDGTYALTISNMCGEESDDINVIEIDPPYFDLGPDTATICSGDMIYLDLEPSLGLFVWQDGTTLPSYVINSPGLYGVTVSNECGVEVDHVLVSQIQVPDLNFGAALEACDGDTIVLSAGNNTGNYVWQDGSTASEFKITTTGTYSLTITNACGIDASSIPIHFNPLLSPPDLGPDVILCPGDKVVLYANVQGANYLWNNLSVADSLVVTAGGTYNVKVSNFCSTFSDTVVVTINNAPPDIQLPPDFALCQGQSTTLDAVINGVNYLWSDGSQTDTLAVSVPGLYALTVTNACGNDADSILITDGGPIPTVSLGVDTSLCAGNSILISPTSSNVTSWLWQDGSSAPLFTSIGAGEIHVAVSNDCGVAYDTLMIGLLPAIPALSLGPDLEICPGQTITLSIPTPNVDILWSDGSVGNDLLISDSVTVYASITNSCGVSADTIEISLLPDAPALDLGEDVIICPGEVIVVDPQVSGVSYVWQDGTTGLQYQITQQGLVTLTISNACGTAIDSIIVTESLNGPQVDLGPDRIACAGETITVESGIGGVDYVWQDGSTADDFIATASGTLILNVTNLCGTDSDTIEIDISGVPPIPSLGPDTSVCEGLPVLLTSNADPITSQVWQDGSTGTNYLATQPGIYSIKQSNRCGEGFDSITISFIDAPDPFTIGSDTVLCPGESFLLSAPPTTFDIQWQDGSTLTEILANQAITYILQLSNECGTQRDSLAVSFDLNVPVLKLDDLISWCEGDIIALDASQPFNANYIWNTGATSSIIVATEPGLYSVSVSTYCAENSDQSMLEEIFDCIPTGEVFLPNVFTPNGDNVNDVFALIPGDEVTLLSVKGTIFDRWGNMVFTSTAIPFSWDGKFHDDLMQPGVFVYIVKVQYQVENVVEEKVLYGDVTLMR